MLGLILSEIIIYTPIPYGSPQFEILGYNTSTLIFKISSNAYPLGLQVVVSSSIESPPPKYIYIYYDPQYQIALVNLKQARGLVDHVVPELRIRGYNENIKVVNASDLSGLLLDTDSSKQSILIVTTGTFPDTVYTQNKNWVRPWIETGGTLFWVGDRFGYYSANKIKGYPNWTDPNNPKSEKYIFGEEIININKIFETAEDKTSYSNALDLRYPYISRAASITRVNALGGKIFGFTKGDSNSITFIPLGNGRVIIFGGGMTRLEEVIVAKDIAQIIASRALDSQLIIYKNYTLGRNEELTGSINFGNNISQNLLVYAFQQGAETTFFKYFELEPKK